MRLTKRQLEVFEQNKEEILKTVFQESLAQLEQEILQGDSGDEILVNLIMHPLFRRPLEEILKDK